MASEPAESLLRFLSVAAPLQLALLWLANRDLHHLAQAAPTIALLVGLSCERIARRLAPPGSTARVVWALVLALPFVLAGVWSCLRTLPTLRTVPSLAVTAHGQRALIDMLHEHEVRQLWTSDYDLYGVFEVLDPDLELAHAWGAASASRDRAVLLQDLLLAARGGHYLVVSPSAPRIYDLHPSHAQLESAASTVGVRLGLLDEVGAGNKASARLYKVESR